MLHGSTVLSSIQHPLSEVRTASSGGDGCGCSDMVDEDAMLLLASQLIRKRISSARRIHSDAQKHFQEWCLLSALSY